MPIEELRQKAYNDELIRLQLSNISLNARPRVEKRAPMKEVVTQKQIDDYRNKLNKPVVVGGVKYKYSKPSEEPELEEINQDLIVEILNEEQIGEARIFINEQTTLYNNTLKEIEELEQNKKDFRYNINNDPDYIKFLNNLNQAKEELEKRKKDIRKYNKKDTEKYDNLADELDDINEKLAEIDKANLDVEEEINVKLNELDEFINKKKNDIKDIEVEIIKAQNDIRDNDINKSINQAEEQRVKEINRQRIKNYQEELNQLNRGEFSIIQQEAETEQEWLKRLNNMGETLYDDEKLKLESNLYNVKELRKNLKELIKDDVIIDDVIRKFNVDEKDVYQLNTIFNPYIKDKFIKIYGKFNPRITEDNVYNLLADILYEGKHGMKKINDGTDEIDGDVEIDKKNLDKVEDKNDDTVDVSLFDDLPPKEESSVELPKDDYKIIYNGNRLEISYSKSKNNLKIYNFYNINKFLYIKPATMNRLLISKSDLGEENTYLMYGGNKGITGGSVIIFLGKWSGTFGDIKDEYTGEYDYDIIKKYIGGGKGDVVSIHNTLIKEYGLKNTSPKTGKKYKYGNEEIQGWGLGVPKDIPKGLIPFGRCKISLYKLYYDNEFILKDGSGFNIPSIKNVKVSDDFVDVIMKVYNKENINQSYIKKLSNNEQQLYDLVVYKCGFKNLDNDHKNNIDKLKEKLTLIEGEIEAGNDNKKVLEDLYVVLNQLAIYKVISLSNARKHYNTIKNDYFKK